MKKKILITGANSYIGKTFEEYMKQWSEEYTVDTVDTIGEEWKQKDFSIYDVIFHVAGIAHVDTKKASEETKKLYYKVNTDLTIECCKKAKEQGVKQFIFMSSIIVYGESNSLEKVVITKDTEPSPNGFYGDSKLQAEKGILPMQSEDFNVAVLRPPMIYGKGSKGNYPRLAKLAQKSPIFPEFDNQRSMLYVGNLCEFIKNVIDKEENGILFPQNKEYVRTTDMVKTIAEVHGKKIHTTRIFNPVIKLMSKKVRIINKVFGSMVYDIENDIVEYQKFDLKNSLIKTEG